MQKNRPSGTSVSHTHRNFQGLLHLFVAHQLNIPIFIVMDLQQLQQNSLDSHCWVSKIEVVLLIVRKTCNQTKRLHKHATGKGEESRHSGDDESLRASLRRFLQPQLMHLSLDGGRMQVHWVHPGLRAAFPLVNANWPCRSDYNLASNSWKCSLFQLLLQLLFFRCLALLYGNKSIHRKLCCFFLKQTFKSSLNVLWQRSQGGKTIQTRYLNFHDSCHISNRGRHCKFPLWPPTPVPVERARETEDCHHSGLNFEN